MLTRDDLLDLISQALSLERSRGPRLSLPQPLKTRVFLSEYDIRKKLTPESQELRIPREAIVSPLAQDWLALKRIKIVRG